MKFLGGGENWTLGGDIPGHPPPLYETLVGVNFSDFKIVDLVGIN